MPNNLALLHLPPYVPQLNAVENVWAYLHGNAPNNRVFDGYDANLSACADAWKTYCRTRAHRIHCHPTLGTDQSTRLA